VKLKGLFVVTQTPWLPTSKSPRDRYGKRRGTEARSHTAGMGTWLNDRGGGAEGTARNRLVSERRGTGHGANSDDVDVDATKVIESCLQTPQPTHRLLIVSSPWFSFCFAQFLLNFHIIEILNVLRIIDFFLNLTSLAG